MIRLKIRMYSMNVWVRGAAVMVFPEGLVGPTGGQYSERLGMMFVDVRSLIHSL
jgi:hypothetical protein